MYVQTDDPKFIRDTKSNAILNKDIDSYRVYKQLQTMSKQITTLEKTVELLRQQLLIVNNKLLELNKNG